MVWHGVTLVTTLGMQSCAQEGMSLRLCAVIRRMARAMTRRNFIVTRDIAAGAGEIDHDTQVAHEKVVWEKHEKKFEGMHHAWYPDAARRASS
jgi:hypothetical protein